MEVRSNAIATKRVYQVLARVGPFSANRKRVAFTSMSQPGSIGGKAVKLKFIEMYDQAYHSSSTAKAFGKVIHTKLSAGTTGCANLCGRSNGELVGLSVMLMVAFSSTGTCIMVDRVVC